MSSMCAGPIRPDEQTQMSRRPKLFRMSSISDNVEDSEVVIKEYGMIRVLHGFSSLEALGKR